MWRSRFGRGYGPIVRQTPERLNEWMCAYTSTTDTKKTPNLSQYSSWIIQ
jgi:hypothetical protein